MTKTYKIVWFIYWAGTFVVLLLNRGPIIGDDPEGLLLGNLIFDGLLGAVLICPWIANFVLRPRRKWVNGKEERDRLRLRNILVIILLDAYCFWIQEYVNNDLFKEMKWYYMLLNVGGIFICTMICMCWFNSTRRAVDVVMCVWPPMAIAFYFVYHMRGEPLQLIDLLSLSTAAEVAGNFSVPYSRGIAVDIILTLVLMGLVLQFRDARVVWKKPARILMRAGVFAGMIVSAWLYLNCNWNGGLGILTDLFAPIKTYKEYGTTVGFFCVAKYMRLTAPDGYSVSKAKEIAEKACEEETPNTVSDVKPVNIIAIMNESWADYRMLGDLDADPEVMPYYDSMKENTIKGHTLVCITGGGTAKTEYEFLTGNSVKRFPGMVPYVSYFTHDQYSLVSTLEAQGYATAAMHPYKGSNWKRPGAYKLLGFDTFFTEEDFDEDAGRVRNFISDQANYEKIIEVLENKEEGQPFFLFDITMQNHGGFTSGKVPTWITINGYEDEEDEAERFLSLERASDDALKYLIEYFKDYDEPTLIVMFGDHYPALPDEFSEHLSGAKYDDLDPSEQINYYSTPFFIWANYDIPEQEDVLTSCNFLGTLMLEQTGLEMPHYNYYLKDLMKDIPALNHMGYFDSDRKFHLWKEGEQDELVKEWEYECLQYNNLAAQLRRLDWFFALQEDNS